MKNSAIKSLLFHVSVIALIQLVTLFSSSPPLLLGNNKPLNTRFDISKVTGHFNNGSTAEITDQFPLEYIVSEFYSGLVQMTSEKRVLLTSVISATSPAEIEVCLKELKPVLACFELQRLMPLWKSYLDVSEKVAVGDDLQLYADADDDIAVKEVQFYMDDSLIGSRETSPYKISIQTNDVIANKTVAVHAIERKNLLRSIGSNTPSLAALRQN